ncbi:hypothetical protein ACJX0J_013560, partial [Zea mays]
YKSLLDCIKVGQNKLYNLTLLRSNMADIEPEKTFTRFLLQFTWFLHHACLAFHIYHFLHSCLIAKMR